MNRKFKLLIAVLAILTMSLAFGTAAAFADENAEADTVISPKADENAEADTVISEGEQAVSADPCEEYTDLDMSKWYRDGVHYCLTNGIMNGLSDTAFEPNMNITRAQIVTMIYRIEGEPAFMNDNIFSDVPSGSYYEKAVVWAQGKGVVSGTSESTFSPSANITREQLSAMLYNYASYKSEYGFAGVTEFELPFDDSDSISEWAKKAVCWCYMKGIINGKGTGFDPKGLTTRAEAAVMLQRFCEKCDDPAAFVSDTFKNPNISFGEGLPSFYYDGIYIKTPVTEEFAANGMFDGYACEDGKDGIYLFRMQGEASDVMKAAEQDIEKRSYRTEEIVPVTVDYWTPEISIPHVYYIAFDYEDEPNLYYQIYYFTQGEDIIKVVTWMATTALEIGDTGISLQLPLYLEETETNEDGAVWKYTDELGEIASVTAYVWDKKGRTLAEQTEWFTDRYDSVESKDFSYKNAYGKTMSGLLVTFVEQSGENAVQSKEFIFDCGGDKFASVKFAADNSKLAEMQKIAVKPILTSLDIK